jgi:nucleoside-diphosphate-sugar epimerase
VRLLSQSGREVISVDIADVLGSEGVPRIHEVVADVRDHGAIASLLNYHRVDTVYDLASFTEAGLGAAAYRRNVDQTRSVVECIKNATVERYVFFSTQFVFRKRDCVPESDEDFAPNEEYGASKVASEKLIRESLPKGRWLIMRPSYVWGPGLARFRDGLLYRLAKGQLMIPSDHSIRRYYGYVRTVAEQAMVLAQTPAEKLTHSVYYLSDEALRLSDFCGALTNAIGSGRAVSVHPAVIRTLGVAGDLLKWAGVRPPIRSLQAQELTTNYPIPIERTLRLVRRHVGLDEAARETIAWAMGDLRFRHAVEGGRQRRWAAPLN